MIMLIRKILNVAIDKIVSKIVSTSHGSWVMESWVMCLLSSFIGSGRSTRHLASGREYFCTHEYIIKYIVHLMSFCLFVHSKFLLLCKF